MGLLLKILVSLGWIFMVVCDMYVNFDFFIHYIDRKKIYIVYCVHVCVIS